VLSAVGQKKQQVLVSFLLNKGGCSCGRKGACATPTRLFELKREGKQ